MPKARLHFRAHEAGVRELRPPETALGFPAMKTLRPGLRDEADFVSRIDRVQRAEGYRLIAILDDAGARAVAVAGFRVRTSLAWGRFVYVDDLATLPQARRRGHAGRLLAWILDEAASLGCDTVHLDSQVGLARADAHRLYLKNGYVISAHHFTQAVRP